MPDEDILPVDVFFEIFDLLFIGIFLFIVSDIFGSSEKGKIFEIEFAEGNISGKVSIQSCGLARLEAICERRLLIFVHLPYLQDFE